MQKQRGYATALVVIHAIIAAMHGLAHIGGNVGLTLFDVTFVGIVISIAPLVAVLLLYKYSWQTGTWLYLIAMIGSFAFGLHHHFLAAGPDNVMDQLPGTWAVLFQATAILLTVLEAVGCIIGLVLVSSKRAALVEAEQ